MKVSNIYTHLCNIIVRNSKNWSVAAALTGLSFVFGQVVWAQSAGDQLLVVETKLAKVYAPESGAQTYHLYAEVDGRIYETQDSSVAATARQAAQFGQPVELMVQVSSEMMEVVTIRVIETTDGPVSQSKAGNRDDVSAVGSYQPTDLKSIEEANQLFDSLPLAFKWHSQCYQRAMTWTYEMYTYRGINSMKAFLFFTRKFINEYHYKWWFHVTPFVYVNGVEYTLDPTFTDKPLQMQDWTNDFMIGNPVCPEIAKYSDYSNHEFDQYCYLRKVPMYYYQPADIEREDNAGTQLQGFNRSDVNAALSKKK